MRNTTIMAIKPLSTASVMSDSTSGIVNGGRPLLGKSPMKFGTLYKYEAASHATNTDEVEYYWVTPAKDWDAIFAGGLTAKGGREDFNKIYQWCHETFGSNDVWFKDRRWSINDQRFCFYNEADRTLFMLKWGD